MDRWEGQMERDSKVEDEEKWIKHYSSTRHKILSAREGFFFSFPAYASEPLGLLPVWFNIILSMNLI